MKDDKGQWISDEDELRLMLLIFFTNLYTVDTNSIESYFIPNDFSYLDTDRYHIMEKSVDDEKIRDIIFSMKPLKAPGIDGLHAIFYQSQWVVVGKVGLQANQRCFQWRDRSWKFLEDINRSYPKNWQSN